MQVCSAEKQKVAKLINLEIENQHKFKEPKDLIYIYFIHMFTLKLTSVSYF